MGTPKIPPKFGKRHLSVGCCSSLGTLLRPALLVVQGSGELQAMNIQMGFYTVTCGTIASYQSYIWLYKDMGGGRGRIVVSWPNPWDFLQDQMENEMETGLLEESVGIV